MAHFMNPQRGRHMEGKAPAGAGDVNESTGQHHPPHIHVHSHSEGHTVHVMHYDGGHEKHEFEHGDSDGIANVIHHHLGGEEGQDHGGSSGEEMENEHGYGSGV